MVDPTPPSSAPSTSVDQPRGHEFDGIVEYDNALPKWFQALFWISILFTPAYVAYYHFLPAKLGAERLATETAAVTAQRASQGLGALTEPELRKLSHDAGRIAKGKELFMKSGCFACHGPEANGLVGPNLRDRFWIYGSDMTNLLDVIRNGRPERGMVKPMISDDEALALAVFIADLNRQGEKPGPKPVDPAREKEAPITY